ncbi:MAG: aminotransferase class I/II-fold pyridoxal phosphate-dependent enzyme, partial [Candidatus Omnitrophica bacterium]|nr:aminotransferase class I/II-fold pyridoxal phosphate-dependent enzyme [Candidatus Omnitrophota bacterium]
AIELVKNLHDRRSKLLSLAGYLRQGLKSLGFEVLGESQIVPVLAGTNEAAMKMSRDLREKGFWAAPVRPPTVPEGEARIRLSISSEHTENMLSELIKAIAYCAGGRLKNA